MEDFLTAAVLWFLLGFVLLLLEFVVPGLILFFFAVGAWIVAAISLFWDISLNSQILIFLGASIVTILIFRKWVKRLLWAKTHSSELIEDEFIGKKGRAETDISPGKNGKVDFKGTSWDATSEDVIEKGDIIVVVGNDSILLIVKSIKEI